MKARILASIAMLAMLGCSSSHQVEYKISGTAETAMITYMVNGTQSQVTEKLPWSHSFTVKDNYQPMVVSAQNQGASGDVKAEIIVDGKSFKTASASNEYGIATASGTGAEL
jgi:hypothetical protein